MASALEQLLNLLHGSGHAVELELPTNTPLIEDPLKAGKKMKSMSLEGAALMKLMQSLGSSVGPDSMYQDTRGVLNRIPSGRIVTDGGIEEEI